MPGGRPSKYQDTFPAQAAKLCRLGATDAELADFFGVSEQTINTWKKEHPQFLEALNEGKTQADARVVASLFSRATGYSHPDTHVSVYEGVPTLTPITKHFPPDVTACIFWLKNRNPAAWRDRSEVEHSGQVGFAEKLVKARERAKRR
jgi:hypothetical protein